MNFFALFAKPQHELPELDNTPMRGRDGQFTLSPRSLEQMHKKASVVAQLAVYCALTSLEQRRDETEAFFHRARGA